MKVETATIANIARSAGFTFHDLHVATALAVCASGGLTEYHHRCGPPGTGDLRGLWAIDVDRVPGYAHRDLHDPDTAARAARELTAVYDGFGWSAPFRAGAHFAHLEHARAESSRDLFTPTAAQPDTLAYRHGEIMSNLTTCADLRRRITGAPRPGGHAWQRITR